MRSQAHHDGKRNEDVLKRNSKKGIFLMARGMTLEIKKKITSNYLNEGIFFVSEIVGREKGSLPKCPLT